MGKATVNENEYTIHIENTKLHIHTENHSDYDNFVSATAFQHKHIFAEIFLCGEESIDISFENGNICSVMKGDVLVVPPGISHNVCDRKLGAKWVVINFLCERTDVHDSEDLYSKLYALYSKKEITHIHETRELYSMAESIISATDKSNFIIDAMRFSELILYIAVKLNGKKENVSEEEKLHKNSTLQSYKKLDKLVNTTFNKEDAVKIISDEMFISVRQLDRIAKKQYGMTLHGIILENRIKYAEKCLKVTDMSIEKIAVSAGFSSRSAFCRAFAAKYRCSPVEYRKKYR